MSIYDNSWCLAQISKYASPIILSVNYLDEEYVSVTEFGVGECTFRIKYSQVLMYGNRKDLHFKLKAFTEINEKSNTAKELL